MKRLTYKHDDHYCINGINGKLTSDKHANYWGEAIDRLAAYEDLEEQNKLLILPCKIGDMVYQPSYRFSKCTEYDYEPRHIDDSECIGCNAECDSVRTPYIYMGKVTSMHVTLNGIAVGINFAEKFDTSHYVVGLDVFLTKEEAEETIKGF